NRRTVVRPIRVASSAWERRWACNTASFMVFWPRHEDLLVSLGCAMLIVPGRVALSAARQLRALAKGRAAGPGLYGLTARGIHLVTTHQPLSAVEAAQLGEMLAYGPIDDAPSVHPESSVETVRFFVTPRVGTTSPWSSKATDIAHVCGLASI